MRQNIPVQQLTPGMKIIALDIGWDKSPKWTQSFVLNTSEDLALLLQHCNIVTIETDSPEEEKPPVSESQKHPRPVSTDQKQAPATEASNSAAHKQAENKSSTAPSQAKADLSSRVSKKFVIDSFHSCLDILSTNFERARSGLSLDASALEVSSKKLLVSTLARPGTLTLLSQLEEKDSSLERKSLDVAVLSLSFGRSLGMSKAQLHRLCMSALLHDIGMIRIPEELLKQKEVLSIGQRISIQKHVDHSCDILHQSQALRPLNSIVAYHHERFDGTGYPAGISGRRIPLEARILAIITTFEAMTRNRHFSNKGTPTQALRNLYRLRNHNFDGKLVERFIQSVGIYPIGTLVELNRQQIGMVTDITRSARSRPKVRCLFDHNGKPLPKHQELDLADDGLRKVNITRTVEPEEIPDLSLQMLAMELGLNRAA
ncbi:HD-GYP domain-containing protein [Oceanospirillum sp.]|uniref:HD-GYP domain-containing protein n=1 Tax=Oceanospirillum sp. TaxID=2021254 RepID=UPI003A8FBE6E